MCFQYLVYTHFHSHSGTLHSNVHYEEPQSNEYFEEPQYSVPVDNLVPVSQYETPVVTSPTRTEEPRQPAPVYDYAAVPQSTAPEYAVLDPQAPVYHSLESPETHTATPAGESEMSKTATEEQKMSAHAALPAGESETSKTATEEQKVVGNHYKTSNQNHYSAIEPN